VEEFLSEKEKWERVKAQVRESGPAVLLAIALAAAGVTGWRWWQAHLDAQRLAAGSKYTQMITSLAQGDRSQALTVLGDLEHNYPGSPYTDQAKLLAARVYVDQAEFDRAESVLRDVWQDSKDKDLAIVARLRLARVQIAQGKPDNALATLAGVEGGAFAAASHEVRGDAYFAKGEKATALKEYQSAKDGSTGTDTPLLNLKIADLAADSPAAARTATAAATPPAK